METEVKGEKPQKRTGPRDPEHFSEMIAVFSEKVPGLVKGLITSVFSEDAATSMAKAASAYYKGLKAGGIPDEVCVQMTKDYMSAFTKMSDMFRSGSKGIGLKIQDNIRENREKSNQEEDEE